VVGKEEKKSISFYDSEYAPSFAHAHFELAVEL